MSLLVDHSVEQQVWRFGLGTACHLNWLGRNCLIHQARCCASQADMHLGTFQDPIYPFLPEDNLLGTRTASTTDSAVAPGSQHT